MRMANPISLADYRTRVAPAPRSRWDDLDLLIIGGLLWSASVARVAATVVAHESFGAESTLALVCALWLPLSLLQAQRPRCEPRASSDATPVVELAAHRRAAAGGGARTSC
jgi:hypothetical protein